MRSHQSRVHLPWQLISIPHPRVTVSWGALPIFVSFCCLEDRFIRPIRWYWFSVACFHCSAGLTDFAPDNRRQVMEQGRRCTWLTSCRDLSQQNSPDMKSNICRWCQGNYVNMQRIGVSRYGMTRRLDNLIYVESLSVYRYLATAAKQIW